MGINLQVGVKTLIKADNKYLLLKRSNKYKEIEGTWDIVGGRIDPGTNLIDNIKREILEETGVVIHETPKLLFAQDILRKDKDLHVVRLSYFISLSSVPHVTIDDESTDYKWFSYEELLVMNNLDEFTKDLLKNIDKNTI